MLTIVVPKQTMFDERTYRFVEVTKETTLRLEHSLVSLSKWEEKWKKPYLTKRNNKTQEEFIDYIRCMTITQNVDPNVYFGLTAENYQEIADYINDPMSARVLTKLPQKGRSETVTNELLYYYMFSFNIPKECEKWHLNRLLNLINLFSDKNRSEKERKRSQRMTQSDLIERDRLNEERKKMFKTRG